MYRSQATRDWQDSSNRDWQHSSTRDSQHPSSLGSQYLSIKRPVQTNRAQFNPRVDSKSPRSFEETNSQTQRGRWEQPEPILSISRPNLTVRTYVQGNNELMFFKAKHYPQGSLILQLFSITLVETIWTATETGTRIGAGLIDTKIFNSQIHRLRISNRGMWTPI